MTCGSHRSGTVLLVLALNLDGGAPTTHCKNALQWLYTCILLVFMMQQGPYLVLTAYNNHKSKLT